jgi:hypothetical protein
MKTPAAGIAAALLAALAPAPAAAVPDGSSVAVLVGSANGGWSFGGSTAWFGDALARNPARISLAVEGAVPLTGWLFGGLRASPLLLRAVDDGTRTSLLVARLEAVATLRPRWPAGPYLRLGLGPAGLWYDAHVPGLASGTMKAGGGSLSLALGGFAVAEGRTELRLEAEASAQAWLPSSGGPDLSWTLGGALGVAWPW